MTDVPTCCVTGHVAGDPNACGDCDPCILGADQVPEAVKRIIKERDEWADKYAGAMMAAAWEPIETAPKDRIGPASYQNHGERILVWTGQNVYCAKWDWHKNGKTGNWKMDDGRVVYFDPTHWMPLPAPPAHRETGGAGMSDLIERLEKATGPDRELDAQIALAVGKVPEGAIRPCASLDPGMFSTGAYSFYSAAEYTRYIDQALTLVPEGVEQWDICFDTYPIACVGRGENGAKGATPAIALCIAALRARSHREALA